MQVTFTSLSFLIVSAFTSISDLFLQLSALPEATIKAHFEKASLRIKDKIWITHAPNSQVICLRLSPENQDVFTRISKGSVNPVNNKWGQKGWTLIDVSQTDYKMLNDMLIESFTLVAPNKDLTTLLKLLESNHE